MPSWAKVQRDVLPSHETRCSPLQRQSGPRLRLSVMWWWMAAGVGMLLLGLPGFVGWGWGTGCVQSAGPSSRKPKHSPLQGQPG